LIDLNIDINNKRIGIAYSAGADSTALFFNLLELKKQYTFEIILFHLTHGIRKQSDIEQDYAITVAKEKGLDFYTVKINCLSIHAQSGRSLEMIARDIRYEQMDRFSKIFNIDYIFLAHHRDDQIETFYTRLFKGTGLTGARGIPSRRGIIIRPWLNISKNQILDYLHKNNIRYFEDETNKDVQYERNYLRKIIIPRIGERFPQYADSTGEFIRFVTLAVDQLQKTIPDKMIINSYFRKKDYFSLNELQKKVVLEIQLKKNCRQSNINKRQMTVLQKNLEKADREGAVLLETKDSVVIYSFSTIYFFNRTEYVNLQREKLPEKIEIRVGKNHFFYYIIISDFITDFGAHFKESVQECFVIDKDKINGTLYADFWKEGDFIEYDQGKSRKLKKYLVEWRIPWFARQWVPVLKIDNTIIGFFWNNKYFLSKLYYTDNKTKKRITIKITERKCLYGRFESE